jgi:hypothetical protein
MFSSSYQFQGIQGPADPMLKSSEIEGYQPVSRIGEVVVNAFVDSYEFGQLPESITQGQMGDGYDGYGGGDTVEHKPHFHEWATVLPGMICLSRKARNATFRNYVAAETATPVIACASCKSWSAEKDFYFAGVCRSKSIRPIDDGMGPSVDEYFTLSIGGMVTMLNNSSNALFPGDVLEWCFYSEIARDANNGGKRARHANVRRIGVKVADPLSEKVIGRVLTFSKPGETFDLLLRAA